MGLLDGIIGGSAFGPVGSIIGGIGSLVGGLFTKTPSATPRGLTLGPYTQGQQQFLQQGKNIGDVSKLLTEANQIDNAAYQKQASQFAPNLFGNIAQNAATTQANLGGNLSTGVQNALGKPGATARDLGETPYQLELQGANRVGNEGATARELNPFNETSTDTLISPAALLKRQDALDTYNNQIYNQGRLMQAGAAGINPIGQGISSIFGGLAGSLRGLGSNNSNPLGYGFGQGDTGPTADTQFDATGNFIGGYPGYG